MGARVWLWLATGTLLFCGIIWPEILSARWAGYSSSANYLSELGAVGAPYAGLTNFFGFLPVAILSSGVLLYIALRGQMDRGGTIGVVLLMFGLSTGYLIAVFFPCDLRCPVQGSARQAIHNLAGLVQYPAGAIGLLLMGRSLLRRSKGLGALCLLAGAAMALGFVMMLVPDQAGWRGAWQRLGDYSAFIAIAIVALRSRQTNR